MPPDSILRAGSAISKRATFWINVSQKLGVPTVALAFIGWGAWIALGHVWEDAVKPVVGTHVRTLDTLADSSKENAASFKVLAQAHAEAVKEANEQKELLKSMGSTQVEIKQVLKAGLKIQKDAQAESHAEKASDSPSGTTEQCE